MMKSQQAKILQNICAIIDGRVAAIPEPGACQFANTWLEGAISTAVLIGKNDLAESIGRMTGELQASLSWAQFRQKHRR